MGVIDKKVSLFNKEDVQLLDSMLKKFHDLKGTTGLPDYSPGYVAYLPVLIFALLFSRKRIERLTFALFVLTVVLAAATIWAFVH
jgi:hypothetical protein